MIKVNDHMASPGSGFSLRGYRACVLVVGSAGSMIGARNASNLRVRVHRNRASYSLGAHSTEQYLLSFGSRPAR